MTWLRRSLERAGVALTLGRLRARDALRGSERGAATAEYALILALVVIVLITALTALGAALRDRINDIVDQINGSAAG